jgi:hypothetical protein
METPEFEHMLWTVNDQLQVEAEEVLDADDKRRIQDICDRGVNGRNYDEYDFIVNTFLHIQEQYTQHGRGSDTFHRLYPRAGSLSDACYECMRKICDARLRAMQRLLDER